MSAGDVMEAVRVQVTAALTPAPHRSTVAPGAEVAWDDTCGQVWVRLVTARPRYAPSARGPAVGCPVGTDLFLGVGVVRCIAGMDSKGRPPTDAQVTADGQQAADDMQAVVGALAAWTPDGAMQGTLRDWTPLGPTGDAAGGEWVYQVLL